METAGITPKTFRNTLSRFATGRDGGDHVIVIGRVERLSHAEEGSPLLFFRSTYAGLDPAL